MENAQRRLTAPEDDEDGDAEMEDGEQRGRGGREVVSRANGGMGMIGVSDSKKKEVAALERKQQKQADRARNRYQAGNEKRGNNQKHWRDHLLQ